MHEGRAHALPSLGQIFVGESTPSRVIAHEIGHLIETRNPQVLQEAQKFLETRARESEANGKTLTKLSTLQNNSNYEPHEVAWSDEFKNPYAGKFYGTGGIGGIKKLTSTEIISMGIEAMVDNPRQFALEEPAYFKFMLKVLQGVD